MTKKIEEKFTRNAVYLNNLADLDRYIQKMTLRCAHLKSEKDIMFWKHIEMQLITVQEFIAVVKGVTE